MNFHQPRLRRRGNPISTKAALAANGMAPAVGIGANCYVDDRSTPAALVSSYYNAVNRREYARAWSYWQDCETDEPYAAFAGGFGNMSHVEIAAGRPHREYADFSIYFQLPVTIDVVGKDGNKQIYSGCYVLRMTRPELQKPPFTPLQIVRASLQQVPVRAGEGSA